MGKQQRRDIDVKTQQPNVHSAEPDIRTQELPSIRVQIPSAKASQVTVVHLGDEVVVKTRYHLQNHPCPSCNGAHGGTGRVTSTQGRMQYVRCRQCGFTWSNPIPTQVPLNQPKDCQWEKIAQRLDAIESAWPSLKPDERNAVANEITEALDKITS